jgi:Mg-chelatase subunit ChlD
MLAFGNSIGRISLYSWDIQGAIAIAMQFRKSMLLAVACCLGCSDSAVAPSAMGRGTQGSVTAGSGTTTATANAARPAAVGGSGNGSLLTTSKAAPGSDVCASALVQTNKNMPTIVFVIDGSGSMCAPFGDFTRWSSLRSALLDPMKGLIYRLQSSVRFGATLYDGTIDTSLALLGDSLIQNPPCALLSSLGKDTGMCPQLVEALPPKLDNAQAIDMIFPQLELGGSTPTDRALGHVIDALIVGQGQLQPDAMAQSRVYVILATDGAPNDICVGGMGGDGSAQRQGVIAAADRGAAAGITTWVISLAAGDPVLQMHLDEVAKHGDPQNTNARTFSPSDPNQLIMTLAQLLGGAVGCNIVLNGTVTVGKECTGTVEQNGAALQCCQQASPGAAYSCNGTQTMMPDGWHLTDPHSIELLGDACAQFLLGAGSSILSARFPCDVFTPD